MKRNRKEQKTQSRELEVYMKRLNSNLKGFSRIELDGEY